MSFAVSTSIYVPSHINSPVLGQDQATLTKLFEVTESEGCEVRYWENCDRFSVLYIIHAIIGWTSHWRHCTPDIIIQEN